MWNKNRNKRGICHRAGLCQEHGFTLLEVTVALVIVALTLVTFIHTQNRSIDLLAETANITTATLLAKQRMVNLESEPFPDLNEAEGTFAEEEYRGYRWRERVLSTPFEGLREVQVVITWEEGRRERTLELVTYIADRTITSPQSSGQ